MNLFVCLLCFFFKKTDQDLPENKLKPAQPNAIACGPPRADNAAPARHPPIREL